MIIGIGTDIIEINRIRKASNNTRFMQKCFTKREIEVLKEKGTQSIAGYFAVKEAVSKAIGTGFSSFFPCDIEITYDCNNKPIVALHGEAKKISEKNGITHIHISISHCESYAVAYAIAERC